MKTGNIIPLSQAAEGQMVSVVSVDGGRGLRGRLTAMGVLANVQIRVVHNGRSGPIVISIKNSRMAIGRGVADKITVI
jgi:Fe2+ transport system protein FeoA